MSDEIDRANDEVLNRLEETLKSVDTNIIENKTGKCLWCEEPVKDKRRWCSAECRADHQLYANKL